MKYIYITIFFLLIFTSILWAESYSPGVYNEVIQQGEDFVRYVNIVDSTGNPVNITGRIYKAQFRANSNSSTTFANFSTSIISATGGRLSINLSKNVTKSIGGKTGYWDLLEQSTDGSIGYLWKGTLSVDSTITR